MLYRMFPFFCTGWKLGSKLRFSEEASVAEYEPLGGQGTLSNSSVTIYDSNDLGERLLLILSWRDGATLRGHFLGC